MKKLLTEESTSDDSEAHRCPDCLNWFRVLDDFPKDGNFYTECPWCAKELIYYEEHRY